MQLRKLFTVVVFSGLITVFLNFTSAQENEFKYIGADKCRMCHRTKSIGNQYNKWKNSLHAGGYEVLATPQAKAQAKEKGVGGDPQQAEECLKCHTTAADAAPDKLASGFKRELGIQCETCHGPGSGYARPAVMNARLYRENREEAREKVFEMGLLIPDEKACLNCHKEPAFDFEEYKEIIAHPVPRANKDR
ncbi:MAG: cytochrome C554 [bacterium]|nr:cytochrome C554 [bacterium]